jgi:estrogen-related receptor beta like 1
MEVSVDNSNHQILQAMVDPIEWKTELERVGPKLRSNQSTSATNEWRSHVDQTVTSKSQIEKVLGDTQSELSNMNKKVSSELNHMRMNEKYLNNQYNSLGLEFVHVKNKLEELEKRTGTAHETVTKLTNDLSELSERLDDLKESFESRDSGLNDTSPLVKIKSALQQIKSEIHFFDMRIGVASHSLLTARVSDVTRLRSASAAKKRQRHNKHKKIVEDDNNSLMSGDD